MRDVIEQAIPAELNELLVHVSSRKIANGRAEVVCNGYQPERKIQTGIGPYSVRIPKVLAKSGKTLTLRAALVSPNVPKIRSLEAALPWLYLKEVSSGEMSTSREVLVGREAQGVSEGTPS